LVAAAIDYEIIGGKHHGAIAERVALDIKAQRRQDAGLDPPPPGDLLLASKLRSKESRDTRCLQGGTVLIGRSTLKEYLSGLHRGYTEGLALVNKEEQLAQELAEDSVFEEEDAPNDQKPFIPPAFTALNIVPHVLKPTDQDLPEHLLEAPVSFPPMAPFILVPFINRIGLKQIPMMIFEFFNRRREVQAGAEAALAIVHTSSRDFQREDLDWGRETEQYYKSSVHKIPSDIEAARATYYKALSNRIATARALERRERQPTKDEIQHPPPTEVELRAERLNKELKWRSQLIGWELVRPDNDIEWDDRFLSLKVFTDRWQN
jgi:import inner membrane translocase subunit TIM54